MLRKRKGRAEKKEGALEKETPNAENVRAVGWLHLQG